MRFNEVSLEEEEVKSSKSKKEKEETRSLAGDKDYDYSKLGNNKTMLGSNPWR